MNGEPTGFLASWQWLAAWSGAALGIVNIVLAMISRRPLLALVPVATLGDKPEIHLRIFNLSKRPVVIRNVYVRPKNIVPSLRSGDTTSAIIRWVMDRRFSAFIPPEATASIALSDLREGSWCIVCVRWSQQRMIFPWSIRLATKRQIQDLLGTGGVSE